MMVEWWWPMVVAATGFLIAVLLHPFRVQP